MDQSQFVTLDLHFGVSVIQSEAKNPDPS